MPAANSALLPALATIALTAAAVSLAAKEAGGPPAGAPAAMFAEPAPRGVPSARDTAVFAGGCFWGVEAVFESLEGVSDAVSGYAGGSDPSPTYKDVSSGRTGHAEAVRV